MSNDNGSNEGASSPSRRRFIMLAGASGVGTLALALPPEWARPIMDLVVVPAYAQSGTVYLADIFRKSEGPLDNGRDDDDEDDDSESHTNDNKATTSSTSSTSSTTRTGTTPTGTQTQTTPTVTQTFTTPTTPSTSQTTGTFTGTLG